MRYQKSTLNARTTTLQAVATGVPVTFNNSKRTGCSIHFNSGSTSITLKRPGLYYIDMSAVGVVTTGSGDISLQLFKNGVAVPAALALATSASTSTKVNLSFGAIVEVGPCCLQNDDAETLTIVNTGVGATYSNLDLNIIKLA